MSFSAEKEDCVKEQCRPHSDSQDLSSDTAKDVRIDDKCQHPQENGKAYVYQGALDAPPPDLLFSHFCWCAVRQSVLLAFVNVFHDCVKMCCKCCRVARRQWSKFLGGKFLQCLDQCRWDTVNQVASGAELFRQLGLMVVHERLINDDDVRLFGGLDFQTGSGAGMRDDQRGRGHVRGQRGFVAVRRDWEDVLQY